MHPDPLRRITRAARRFGRRPRAVQLRTLAVAAAVLGGAVAYVAGAPAAGTGSAAGSSGASGTATGAGAGALARAGTASRGVTARTVTVAFPVVALSSLAGKLGFASDAEFGEQTEAIHLFVNHVNRTGGIDGRRIVPVIDSFDPTDESSMRALCKDWTEGSRAVFAVLDGEGTWSGDNQLCITQEGHTPLLSQWTTTTNWTAAGSPYLWWTGPDDAPILQATVDWGLSSGRLSGSRAVGVIVGDRASDQQALHRYLLPDLARAGVRSVVETIAADPSETATTDADAPLVVQKLRSAGVTSVIPMVPFNVLVPVLQAETEQRWYPKLLLSDYEETIESALGLIPQPFEAALDGQEGVTTETLGGFDDTRPELQGGYDPAVRRCYALWHAAHPKPLPGNQTPYIEEQGPIAAWCGVIDLFTAAARSAGRRLDRRTFVEAMARVRDFPGTLQPIWTFGPDKAYGPVEYQVVALHNNVPPTSACKLISPGKPQGTCWVVEQSWEPLPSG